VNANGDVIVENVDGTQHRVLVPTTTPSGSVPRISVLAVIADCVLVSDFSGFPAHVHLVSLADGSSIDVADASVPSSPFGPTRFLGASPYSTDAAELLFQSTTGLIAVTLATGAVRSIATFDPSVTAGGAAFLDPDHVVWVRVEDHSLGDEGMFGLSV